MSPVQVDMATTDYYPVPYQILISNRNLKFESADRQDSKSFDRQKSDDEPKIIILQYNVLSFQLALLFLKTEFLCYPCLPTYFYVFFHIMDITSEGGCPLANTFNY